MKAIELETLDQINRQALDALYREIGVSKTIRFLRQFRRGEGDYTKRKQETYEGKSVDEILEEMNESH